MLGSFGFVLTSELKSKVDRLWDAFWSGGVSNPLEVVEQVSYLLFLRLLDEMQTARERSEARAGEAVRGPIYGEATQNLRWSRLTEQAPPQMLATLQDEVIPWLRSHPSDHFTFSRFVRDARCTIPTPSLLVSAVDTINSLPVTEPGTMGDVYQYMLAKLSSAGSSGQFRTPLHIVRFMVEMMAPSRQDEVCDPACGTGGFLTAAAEFARDLGEDERTGASPRDNGGDRMFHGFDFDSTMLRIASMNMMLHGFDQPDIQYRDSLAGNTGDDAVQYSVILTNPPFAGSLDYESVAQDLQLMVRTKKSELLFLARVMRLLKVGGRAAVIVPEGVLWGTSAAHRHIRELLVERNRLDAVVKLPGSVFKPYAGVSSAILVFSNIASKGTDFVWFYEVTGDGFTLDDRRSPLLSEDKLGPTPAASLSRADSDTNNLPDALARWRRRDGSERKRSRAEQSFSISKGEIAAQGYDLSVNCYRRLDTPRSHEAGGWRLGDIAHVRAGSVRSAEIDRTRSGNSGDRRVRVLHPSYLISPLPGISDLPVRVNATEPAYRLRAGDIVGRDLANPRYWTVLPEDYEGVQPGQGIIVISLFREVLPAQYLVVYLSSPQAEVAFPRYGTIPRIRIRDLADFRVPECEGDLAAIQASASRLDAGPIEAGKMRAALDESRKSIFDAPTSRERRVRLEQAGDFSYAVGQALRKRSEPDRIYQETYPYAIARAVRRFKHSPSLAEQHEAVLQCAESLILSLGILSLALAAQVGQQNLAEIAAWQKSVREGGASLGHLVAVVRAVGAETRESGDMGIGLAEATAARKGGAGLMADLGRLVNHRNKIRHGSGPRTHAEVEKSLGQLTDLVFAAMGSSAFLARSQWVNVDRLRWLSEIGRFRISGRSLMGDHPDFEMVEFETDRPLDDDRLYVRTPQSGLIPLSPYCILSDCPRCLAPELYYPDRLTKTTAMLKSLDRGHELDSETVFRRLSLPELSSR